MVNTGRETMVNSGTADSSRKTMVDGDIGRQWPILAERQWSTLADNGQRWQ